MRVCYIDKNFNAGSLATIADANGIIHEYRVMGLSLTLRQLYYQFVSRDLIANKQSEYKRLGSIINDARMAGLVDWEAIEDRTRIPTIWAHTETSQDAIDDLAGAVSKDQWDAQETAVEVWIEKDALTGVISTPCMNMDVPYFACKGYNSASAAYRAGQRALERGKPTVILHLGDHDPSGLDMTKDIQNKFDIFTRGLVQVRRIALNMDQIDVFNPPPNPTKLSDSRARGYIYPSMGMNAGNWTPSILSLCSRWLSPRLRDMLIRTCGILLKSRKKKRTGY